MITTRSFMNSYVSVVNVYGAGGERGVDRRQDKV
jgi:hypothetical protein